MTPSFPPLRIGTIIVDPPLVLAPMAGVSHIAFRRLVRQFGGCGLYFSEMLASRAVPHEKQGDSIFLRKSSDERPFLYQLAGKDPSLMVEAIRVLEERWESRGEERADGFDINMGCGAPRIRNNGSGAGLLLDRFAACRIVRACREATSLPLTVKMRILSDDRPDPSLDFARMLQDEGIDAVTLHPRLGKEKFKKRARWDYIAAFKKYLTIPVIGNGDIRCGDDVRRRFAETGCDGIMIGRQAAVRPWIFREAAGWDPVRIDLRLLYQEFATSLTRNFPPEKRIGRLKQFTHYFAANFRFGHHLAAAVQNASTLEEAVSRAEMFMDRHAKESIIHGGMRQEQANSF